jgi:osmotically-inducible protein OsmY
MANRYSKSQRDRGGAQYDNRADQSSSQGTSFEDRTNRERADQYGQQNFNREDRDQHLVGRDFMTNQPDFERYGEMEAPARNRADYLRQERDLGSRQRYFAADRGERNIIGRHYGSGEFRNPDDLSNWNSGRTFGGTRYGSSGEWERNRDWESQDRDRSFESGRTPFDESIAGRPYWGGSEGYYSGGYERPRSFYDAERYGSSYGRDRESYRDRGERPLGEKVRDFFGVGPKGYKRSDDRIREDVSERLADHPYIDASEIEVQVNDGEVTLTGTVDERRQKRLAEDVAENARGVRDVHNQIRVNVLSTSGANVDIGSTGKTVSGTRRDKDKESAA